MAGFLLATVGILVGQTPEYVPYRNDRFGFSFERPTFLRPGRPPENGDGLEFRSVDGRIRLVAYGSGRWNYPSLESERKRELRDLAKGGISPSMDQREPGWFAISYRQGREVFYEKAFMTQEALVCLRSQYPVSEKARMDGVMTRIVRSFNPGGRLVKE